MCRPGRRLVMVTAASLLCVGAVAESASEPALAEAAKRRDRAAVRGLLATKADVNVPSGDGATALHWAVFWDDLEMVDLLLRAGANVNAANDLQITPVFVACSEGGHQAIVERLLDTGADPNRVTETGVTPLMESARTGNVGAVHALLAGGANVNAAESTRGQTALMWAVSQRHPAIVRALVAHGVDLMARTTVGAARVMVQTGSQQGARRGARTSKDAGVTIATGSTTALLFAAQVGDLESATVLLDAGANPNDEGGDGSSALVTAVHAGNGAVARLLLTRGANPNAAGAGYTALHAAALHGDLETVNALVARGADLDAHLTKPTAIRRIGPQLAFPGGLIGATPLLVAAANLEVEVLRALIAAGADVSASIDTGHTPLLAVVGVGDRQLRLTRPKDFDETEEFSDLARAEDRVIEAVRLLLDRGANPRASDAAGETAVHGAASAGLSSVIQLLADRGAELDMKNKRGRTPLALVVAAQESASRASQDGRAIPLAALQRTEALLRRLGASP